MPDAPPPPPRPRRRLTIWIAASLLCLGLLGLVLSGVGLASLLAGEDLPIALPRSRALADAFLQVLGKCGLTAMAVTMLMRHRTAVKAAYAGLAVSAAGTLYTMTAVIPAQAAAVEPGLMYALGAYAVSLLALLLYVGPILYMRTAASRKEFGLDG